MGKRSKAKAKSEYSEDEEKRGKENQKCLQNSSFVFAESDDEEANEDLSLKIVEKAMSRTSKAANLCGASGEDIVTTDFVALEIVNKVNKKEKKKKKKKKKVKKVENETQVTMTKEETEVGAVKDVEVVNVLESDAVDNSNSDNAILRMLLRGPRYFDPPDKSWGACFNCGEEGHSAVNCTSARRKKPCFICGSLEHEVKQCQKGQDCFICKGGGHRAKDCPKRFKRGFEASELCLKCGASAHSMSLCNNDYSPDDLKEIQCYVCKRFGHLCCVDYLDALLSEVSCYKCGHSGHNGQDCRGSRGEMSAAGTPSSCFKCREEGHFARECTNSSKEFRGSRGERSAAGTPSSCFKCGEEGHFARECSNSSKGKKRTHDLSTPTRKCSREDQVSRGFISAPQDYGKARKKRLQYDNSSPIWSSKSNRRGGWIPDDPSDLPPENGWRSPSTPKKKHKVYGLTAGGQGSNSQSSKRWSNYNSGNSSSRRYENGYEHRFSGSRFGNSSSGGIRRNYEWW